MKVLYIGHYREGGGWSQAATDNILAMDSVGMDIVCRDIKLTQNQPAVHPRLLELEKKSTHGCDYCIQHVLPHHMVGTNEYKRNIGFVELESTSIKGLSWFEHLKKMDVVWVSSGDSKRSLDDDNLGVPVELVHKAHDIKKYTVPYKAIAIPAAQDTFKFYYIGDLNDRKNLRSIIRCFHSEFDRSEAASLILKTNKFGSNPEQVKQAVDKILLEVKTSLRLYKDINHYRKDIVITGEIPEENIYSLHQYGDCFLCPSHGEAWSIPSFEAMAFGSTPICSDFGGPKEFIDREDPATGSLINGVYSMCQCSDSAFPDMFTGREYWFTPCERSIRQQMRYYFDNRDARAYKVAGLTQARKFSYNVIGDRIKDKLHE